MCERLSELREAMAAVADGFDAGAAVDLSRVVEHAAAIEAMAATVKAMAAARAADVGHWQREGHPSAAAGLASATGTSRGSAAQTIKTGQRLDGQPLVAAAARRGELSTDQLALICAAASANPRAEGRLLEVAAGASLSELRQACAQIIAAAYPDADERRRMIRRRRRLRHFTDEWGMWHLSAQGVPDDGARIMAALEPLRDELFEEARKQDRREPAEVYAFDALVRLAAGGPAKSSPRAKIIVRVDWEALIRGYPTGAETCELAGYGPIPVSAVRDLMDTGDPFLAAVITKGRALVGVAHLGRRANAHQQTALEWLYPSCAAQGCPHQAFLQNDHRIDWAKTHYTAFDLLDRLCSHHHQLKTRHRWALVAGRGKRPFVPPDDPRHPSHGLPETVNAHPRR